MASDVSHGEDQASSVSRVIVAVRGLLYQRSTGGVLLLRRSSTSNFSPGHWELPGGKFDATSMSIAHALEREFMEETSIPVVMTQPPIYKWDKPAGLPPKYSGDVSYMCDVFRVHLLNPEYCDVRLSDEHDAYKWIKPVPEEIKPFGDYIPLETRIALELFYHHYIYIPSHITQS